MNFDAGKKVYCSGFWRRALGFVEKIQVLEKGFWFKKKMCRFWKVFHVLGKKGFSF